MKNTILIVDDKEKLCTSLVQNFNQHGYNSLFATSSRRALKLFKQEQVHAVLLDIMLGKENGIDLLEKLLKIDPKVPVIMITGYASIDTAVKSIKLGAFDYIQKPLDFEKLFNIVGNAISLFFLREENRHLKRQIGELVPKFITVNKGVKELLKRVEKLAKTNLPVLICGENGTGKELIADLVHSSSSRHTARMLKINCASLAENLLENELFGHEKGAYTGADTEFIGVFEQADQNSLFLDEIGDMSISIQAKILRVLQNNEIRRLGGDQIIIVDVRFIAATNKNLLELIQEKKFRDDLYYRLNTAIINIPPLRNRKDDIPILVDTFLTQYSRINAASLKTVSPIVMEKLIQYDWPGNVRELKNVINYACAITNEKIIGPDDLPPHLVCITKSTSALSIREELDKNLLIKILQQTGNNKKKAAELLQISRKTLYNKLNKYEL